MLASVAENATLFYLLLGIAALVLGARWWMTRNNKLLLGLIPVVALGIGVWCIATFTDTDQKKIQRIVEEMALGVREGNAERIFRHVSRTMKFRNMRFTDFRAYAEKHLRDGKAKDVTVSKFSFSDVSRAAAKAKVEFWAHTEEALGLPIRCEADFALEEGVWRMTTLELFQGNFQRPWQGPGLP
jgi:hypothetical protein